MADNEFRDVFLSDSEDEDFAGFEQIDLNEAEIDGLVDVNNVELDYIDLREIVEEIDREERDAFHEAYEHDWLQNFAEIPGPRHIDAETTPYEIFSHFFHNDILELLVNQTNLYYDQYIIAKGGLETFSAHSRVRAWIPVTLPEMKAFIAIILFQGLVRMPNYDMYWSTHHLINLKSLSSYMTRDRFLNILSFLHACDNSVEPPRDSPDYDPSYKISRISQLLIAKWREFYHPNREVSVDETLVPFKGRTKFLQYIPSKPHKWGLKVWTLADSKSGYVWNWQLYTGKKNHEHGMGATHAIVMTWCEPLLNLGHHLYCDNYFTSPALFDDLANHQTGACGTLRVNRNGVPRQVKTAKLNKGDPPLTCRDGRHLYITWHDKRPVNLLTTVHNGSTYTKTIRSRFHEDYHREVDHPRSIQLYTHFMGGVDIADQQTRYCVTLHKMLKWWKKLFLCNLLEVSVANAKVIYKQLPGNVNKRIKTEKFRLEIIEGLLEGYDIQARPFRRPVANPPTRLTSRHFPKLNPKTIGGGRRSNPDCEVCSNRAVKRHQTQFYCVECEKPMCAYPCFERYHSMKDYKIDCTADLHK